MSSASRASAGAVAPIWSPPRRDWSLLAPVVVPGRGNLLGSEFDSIARLRHFRELPRRSAELVRMVEKRFVVSREISAGWLRQGLGGAEPLLQRPQARHEHAVVDGGDRL